MLVFIICLFVGNKLLRSCFEKWFQLRFFKVSVFCELSVYVLIFYVKYMCVIFYEIEIVNMYILKILKFNGEYIKEFLSSNVIF